MYHYENTNTNETVAQLPKVWNYHGKANMGITEANMAAFGWRKVETPDPVAEPMPKHYSKLLIMRALESAGLWATVKNAITDAGRWDAFLLAQDLAGDDPDFLAMKAALDAMLPVDSETILQNCETGVL
jgi:hypothetical protein